MNSAVDGEVTELPSSEESQAAGQLERGHLPLWKAAVLALTAMQVGPSMALAAGSLMTFVGVAGWFTYALAAAAISGVAIAVASCARRYVVTGSLVSYVYQTLGPGPRLVTAAALILGYLVVAGTVTATAVVFTTSALIDVGVTSAVSPAFQCASAVAISAFAMMCAYRGVDTSVTVATTLGFACMPLVIYITALAWGRGDAAFLPQFDIRSVSLDGMMQGTMVAYSTFVGFDGLTSLAAETAHPKRNIPRVLLGTIAITAIGVIAACTLQAPILASHAKEIGAGASPVAVLAEVAGESFLKVPADLLLAPAVIASVVAFYNFGARVIATAAVDGLLPRWLAAVHPKLHSPHRAVVVLGLAGALTPAAIQLAGHTSPLLGAVYLGNLLSYYWLAPYVLTCAGAVWVQLRAKEFGILTTSGSIAGAMLNLFFLVAVFLFPPDRISARFPYIAVLSTAGLSMILALSVKPSYWRRAGGI